MLLEKLHDKTIDKAGRADFTVQYNRGHINGIFLTYSGWDATDNAPCENLRNGAFPEGHVTIKRRHEKGLTILATRIPIRYFEELSLNRYGKTISGSQISVAIDLGSLHLDHHSDLEIDISLDIEFAPQSDEKEQLTVGCFQVDKAPDFMYQYDTSKDLEQEVYNIDEIYFSRMRKRPVKAYESFRDFKLDFTKGSSYMFDSKNAIMATTLFTNSEDAQLRTLSMLYSNDTALPKGLALKTYQDFEADEEFFLIRRIYDVKSVSKNTVKVAEEYAEEIEKIEIDDPETAKALRHANKTVKSEIVKEGVKQVKELEKAALKGAD